MMRIGFATALVGAAAAAVIGLAAPAQAAPTGPGNAQQTISEHIISSLQKLSDSRWPRKDFFDVMRTRRKLDSTIVDFWLQKKCVDN